ncbi:AsnC family transcriptional regulator [Desulfovirgula thermocuniculi]|uniref:siroheme decarboxylase subunit alpha n=1 Tax=Desulfovirgula thermocuniculi TaxID=348842 RepID=UPI000410CAAE|nr:AsnC family transcriptional regulator [Desulfovirgula thermocuniculi]
MNLDNLDRQLLNLIQSKLPLTPEPYKELARALGSSEEEVINRIRGLIERGVIRRLGAIFDSRRVGYTGTLCALKVPPERIPEVAGIVNRLPGVTHNYLRDHPYNMWFTLLAESPEELNAAIEEIKRLTGIEDLLNLPAEKVFKIRVNFELEED